MRKPRTSQTRFHNIYIILTSCLLVLFVVSQSGVERTSAGQIPWVDKVDPLVIDQAADGESEFLVVLTEQADLTNRFSSKADKGQYVFDQLTKTARQSQAPLLRILDDSNAAYRSFWVLNMIWVRGNLKLLQLLAEHPTVSRIYANPWVALQEVPGTYSSQLLSPTGIPWNIQKIQAPDVWALGVKGEGAVIAGQDTGYEWNHPALINQYRGWNGSEVDHNYQWHDAIHDGSSSCGINLTSPCDDHGHGTHTMGTMVGDDGYNNQIGVAPEARWIGCRNMRSGVGTPATYSECYQWFIAPTDLNNKNPRPELAPDVINNSWSCTTGEGCTDPEILHLVVQNVRAAGILTVHSAGNSGPACGTVNAPSAIYDESFTIGATDSYDVIASFSSRGPVIVDNSNRLKPNVSAPGISVYSSTRSGGYTTLSGTSMAAPHVAGLAALVVSAYPELKGQVDDLENLIEQTAIPINTSENCSGTAGLIPNNTYGWGRINALNAVQGYLHRLAINKSVSAALAIPGNELTYTLTVSHAYYQSPTHNVVLTDVIPSGTIFLESDTEFTITDDEIQWHKDSLTPDQTWTVTFKVRVISCSGWIENSSYDVLSQEVSQKVTGPPIKTQIREPILFLPVVGR